MRTQKFVDNLKSAIDCVDERSDPIIQLENTFIARSVFFSFAEAVKRAKKQKSSESQKKKHGPMPIESASSLAPNDQMEKRRGRKIVSLGRRELMKFSLPCDGRGALCVLEAALL